MPCFIIVNGDNDGSDDGVSVFIETSPRNSELYCGEPQQQNCVEKAGPSLGPMRT